MVKALSKSISIDKNINNQVFKSTSKPFLRYPGGKQRQLSFFEHLLPIGSKISGSYVEPFIGGGSVFFHVNPKLAILSDKNQELIDLYIGIRDFPEEIWKLYSQFPTTKKGYYDIRDSSLNDFDLPHRAARTLFLNRTCFKGMWRHNSKGKFNIGYGGQDRRWVISKERLYEVSAHLSHAKLECCDFEPVINECVEGDFLFLDPPYCPGEKEQQNTHYTYDSFSFDDQKRLSNSLRKATKRGISWVMTNSSNSEIVNLYENHPFLFIEKGTGELPGLLTKDTGEIIIYNLTED
jgi:DNA adenine methylase